MVGREPNAIGESYPLVDNALVSARVDKPDALVRGIREIDFSARVHRQIVRLDTFGEHGFLAIPRPRHNPFASVLASVEPAVWPKHQAVGAAGIFLEDRNLAIEGDSVNAVVRNIAEKYVAFRVDGGPFGELVTLAHQLPIFVRIENVVGEKVPLAVFRLGDRLRVVAPEPAQGVRQYS